jgi:hypothetical protein
MKIKAFDKANLRLLTNDIQLSLRQLSADYGISLTYKSARFSPSNVSIKLEGATINASGVVETKERKDWKLFASYYGLKESWLDKAFVNAGEQFVVVGLAPRKRKFPVLATCVSTQKRFKFPVETIKALLAKV